MSCIADRPYADPKRPSTTRVFNRLAFTAYSLPAFLAHSESGQNRTQQGKLSAGKTAEVRLCLHARSERFDLARIRHIARRRLLCTPNS
jgi:hypothetical protein